MVENINYDLEVVKRKKINEPIKRLAEFFYKYYAGTSNRKLKVSGLFPFF